MCPNEYSTIKIITSDGNILNKDEVLTIDQRILSYESFCSTLKNDTIPNCYLTVSIYYSDGKLNRNICGAC